MVGKPLGIIGLLWIGQTVQVIKRDDDLTWGLLFPVSLLAGIGFTMSLFIGGLAFDGDENTNAVRAGVIVGSTCSAILAFIFFKLWERRGPKV